MNQPTRSSASMPSTWPARYTFCDALWRGRARLLVDAELEAALCSWVAEGVAPEGLGALVEALVPQQRAVPVWMVVGSEETVRLLAPHFPGTRFLAVDTLEDRLARLPWEIALIAVDRRLASDDGRLVTPTGAESVALDVAAAMRQGRFAVIASIGSDVDYEGFADQLRPTFGEPRIYGGYAPQMFAFAEFVAELRPVTGEFLMSDEHQTSRVSPRSRDADEVEAPAVEDADAWDAADDGEGFEDDEGVPLSFDNTLGPDAPPYAVWIAVVGASEEFAEGLTLVELPTASAPEPTASALEPMATSDATGPLGEIRAQLHQAKGLAESATLERQRLVERLDAALADTASLRDTVNRLREQLAGALDQPSAGERLDAALAREQSLRWRVAALEREIAELRVRPVSELEADNEQLRARLEHAKADHPVPARPADAESSTADRVAPRGALPAVRVRVPHQPDAARRLVSPRAGSGRAAALRVVEGLVRRIDQGVERASLRRELLALRRRLRG